MRTPLVTGLVFSMTFASATAMAQGCPPGSWFCADGQVGGQAGTTAPPAAAGQVGASGKLEPLPAPAAAPGTTVVVNTPPPAAAPAPAPQPAVVAPRPSTTVYVPVTQPWPQREWGLNLHFQGAMIGKREGVSGAGLAGLGGALRYRPSRSIALEGSLDLFGGTDYSGRRRSEAAFSVGGYLFLSPLSRTQPYITGGIGWAAANVRNNDFSLYGTNGYSEYQYFGGYVGAGIEHRMNRSLAINVDLRGFVRGRTDEDGTYEFVSNDGRATNTSGGVLLNLGATLYF